jgi:threonine dehydratase
MAATPISKYRTPSGRPIWVKDESQYDPGLPNGKLRGVIPYLAALRDQGVRGVVNAGASQSNSHAIAAYAGRRVGVGVITCVNTYKPNGYTCRAADLGASVFLHGPGHLGPLRAYARHVADTSGYEYIPWGFATAGVVDHTAMAVAEVPDDFDVYCVSVGSGGYAAALAIGVVRYDRACFVIGVPAMNRANTADRVRALLTPDTVGRLELVLPVAPVVTPFPSDPRYEHAAWGIACAHADMGARVLFWSVGQPLGDQPCE